MKNASSRRSPLHSRYHRRRRLLTCCRGSQSPAEAGRQGRRPRSLFFRSSFLVLTKGTREHQVHAGPLCGHPHARPLRPVEWECEWCRRVWRGAGLPLPHAAAIDQHLSETVTPSTRPPPPPPPTHADHDGRSRPPPWRWGRVRGTGGVARRCRNLWLPSPPRASG